MLPVASVPCSTSGMWSVPAKCSAVTACLYPFVQAVVPCSSIYEGRNTETDEGIAGECGPVLLALTLMLARNWISVLKKIPSSEGVLLQPEGDDKTEEKTATDFRGREMQKDPVLRALNHHFQFPSFTDGSCCQLCFLWKMGIFQRSSCRPIIAIFPWKMLIILKGHFLSEKHSARRFLTWLCT